MYCSCGKNNTEISMEDVYLNIKIYFKAFKIDINSIDDFEDIFTYHYKEVINTIKNLCSINIVPAELEYVVSRRTLAKLLNFYIMTSGKDIDDNAIIDGVGFISIKEGDVEVKVNETLTPQKLLNNFIRTADNFGKNELARFSSITSC